jgi:hypothetical protein
MTAIGVTVTARKMVGVRVATALSVGKSVQSGTLSHANSALAALQLGARRGQLFITSELGMMQAILMTRTN